MGTASNHAGPAWFPAMLTAAAFCVLASAAFAQEDSWKALAELPTPRRLLSAATFEGKIYTFGGCGSPCFEPPVHNSTFEETLVEVYDPKQDSWSKRKPIPAIFFGAAAATVGERIYLFGGFVTGNATYAYDPEKDAWQRRAPMPTSRHGMAAVTVGEKIYVLGGSTGAAASNALEVYDPKNDRWDSLPPMPTARVFLAAAAVDGKIYAIGGSPDCCGKAVTNAVEVYDTETKEWSSAAPLLVALQVSAAAEVNEKVYVFGGFIPGVGAQGSTFEYDPTENSWTTLTAMPEPRDQAPAVVLDGQVYVPGGSVNCHCRALGTHSRYTPPPPPPPVPPPSGDECLRIRKTDDKDVIPPGSSVFYRITVRNVCDTAVRVTVADNLTAAGLEDVHWCRGQGCTPVTPGNLLDSAEVPPKGSLIYQAAGSVPCECGFRSVTNRACAESDDEEVCASDTDRITPEPGADLALELTGPEEVAAGGEGSYTITVTNLGLCTARGVEIQGQIPVDWQMVEISPLCAQGLTPCRLEDLAPGPPVVIAAKLKAPVEFYSPAMVTVRAAVASDCDSVAANNAASVTTVASTQPPPLCMPDLAITKSNGLDMATPGDAILYTIVVENRDRCAIAKALVKDVFPPELEQVNWCRGLGCAPNLGGDLVDTLDLPAHGKETYVVEAVVSPMFAGTLSNTATVSPPAGVVDVDPGNNSSTDTDEILPAPGVTAICKEILGTPVEGGVIAKLFVLWNGGPADQADNLGDELVDVLPPGLTLVGAVADSGVVAPPIGNTVRWNGAIPAGSMVTIRITAMIDPGTAGQTICNLGTVSFDADGDGVNESMRESGSCCVIVLPVPRIPVLNAPGVAALVVLLALMALARMRRGAAG